VCDIKASIRRPSRIILSRAGGRSAVEPFCEITVIDVVGRAIEWRMRAIVVSGALHVRPAKS